MVAYVHIYQSLNGLTMVATLYRRLYVHLETSWLFMLTYTKIFNGLVMVSLLYMKFYVHLKTSLLLMSPYIRIFKGLVMMS